MHDSASSAEAQHHPAPYVGEGRLRGSALQPLRVGPHSQRVRRDPATGSKPSSGDRSGTMGLLKVVTSINRVGCSPAIWESRELRRRSADQSRRKCIHGSRWIPGVNRGPLTPPLARAFFMPATRAGAEPNRRNAR